MPPKKEPKKKVTFNKTSTKTSNKSSDDLEINNNIFITKNAPKKEKLFDPPARYINDESSISNGSAPIQLDEKELDKETELETELDADEEDEDEDEINADETEQDEDHALDDALNDGLNDETEYEDDMNKNEDYDNLYQDMDNVTSKKKSKTKEDTEDLDKLDDDCEYDYGEIYDEKKEEEVRLVTNEERITIPKLTKYEKVRLIGTRAKQLSLGAKVMIKNTEGLSPIEIAKLELKYKMIAMKIKRVLPDNSVEIWKLSELD